MSQSVSTPRKLHVITFGCQMNEHDSRKMSQLLSARGWETTDTPESADLIVLNTCTIRDKAEQKALSEIGRYRSLKREKPGLRLALAGCVAQRQGEALLKRAPYVDLVIGPDNIASLPRLLDELDAGSPPIALTELYDHEDYPFVGADAAFPVAGPSAYVTVQKGCDKHCTFCIVPTVRGGEVTRAAEEILDEVAHLARRGVREVTLLGQTVNSWGKRLDPPQSFAGLLRRVAEVPGIARVRFTTSYPLDLDADLVTALAEVPALCGYLHLPVQSGSNRILKRMGRGYTVEQYLERIDALRAQAPRCALATDIIVGFPGETDDDFEQTMAFVERVRFDGMFSFTYSPRPDTPAIKLLLRDDVAEEVKSERLQRLQSRQREISEAHNRRFLGTTVEVLVEGPSRTDPGTFTGRTTCNRAVSFAPVVEDGTRLAQGDLARVEIGAASPFALRGRVVASRRLPLPLAAA